MDLVSAVVERESRADRMLVDGGMADGGRRAVAEGAWYDHPAGVRRRSRSREAVLRAGQLVPRRRRADAVHRLAVRGTESDAPELPTEHVAGRPDPGGTVVRP